MSENIAQNIQEIKSKISAINPNTKLVAVSKNHDADAVRAALSTGHRIFGENRVQEAEGKYAELKKEFPDIELHLIGPLQTNKVKDALELFDVIETLDREKLANEIAKHFTNNTLLATRRFFIQVNIGEEEQKAGISPKETKQFYEFCTKDLKLPVTGLMCIPPVDDQPFMYFALLKKLSHQLSTTDHQPLLSMGMSADYLDATELGASYVRVGTAIFGDRVKP